MNTQVIHRHFTNLARAFVTNALAIVLAALAGSASANTVSWHINNGNGPLAATDLAGVNPVTNWVVATGNGTINNLGDNTGAATTLDITASSPFGPWRISGTTPAQDSDGSYNKRMINPYLNAAGNTSVAIAQAPYAQYTVYAYFSSDTAGRTGTVTDGTTTYSFTTLGPDSISGGNATLTQTTDTSGGNPGANYAVFTNLSGSKTITCNVGSGGGLSSVQIVDTTPPSYLSLATDISADAPATNYAGRTVTLSVGIAGTAPITNQWQVDTGSGFVPVAGATNTTLILTNAQVANSGAYQLLSSNSAGATNSSALSLVFLDAPTNDFINVQFTGGWLGGGYAPTQTGPAVIGNTDDVWNPIGNTTGGTTPAGLARGTNIALVDAVGVGALVTMDYVGDYIFNGSAFGFSNPFIDAFSPVAPLMTGYMGSVSQGATADTNTVTLKNVKPGSYDLYLFANGRSDGQGRITVFGANGQSAICGPNGGNNTLIAGSNYVHLTPTVASNGVLTITAYGTTDNGQGLWNGIQLYGPVTLPTLFLSTDTTSDSPVTNYAGRNITLTASFGGFPAPALQWKVDKGSGFVNVSASATNASLTLANIQTSDTGSYALFATNVVGELNSTPLALVVLPAPTANFGVNLNLQFDGTAFNGVHATPQVGPAVIGNAGDFWTPVSNPNPVGGDTNRISGSILGLVDAGVIGTSYNLSYLGDQDFNSQGGNPFFGFGSPAENLMQAALIVTDGRTGTVTLTGLPAGTYDLYLYSAGGNTRQTVVTRFAANGAYDTAGPNDGNFSLIEKTNYVHLTPTVGGSGVLTISLTGLGTAEACLNGLQLSGPGATVLAPVAGFAGTPTNTFVAQPVAFADTSSGNITNWVWSFGDGSSVTNTSGSVTHAYAAAGTYSVSLTANGPGGSGTTNQVGYITVNPLPTISSTTLSGGNLILSGSGGLAMAGAQYRILNSTNITVPLANWTAVWTNVFEPDGSFSYTNSPVTGPASFFRLATP
jgi:PKD repeat protein